MPTKLKVLVGLMGLSIALNIASQSWISVIIGGLLLFGVLKGSEGVRNILMFFAVIGLLFGVFAMVTTGALLIASGGLAGIVARGGLGVSMDESAFLLWCLSQKDVQMWMFHRSSGGMT